ncbi:MAG: trypsin-like peptidase domain-containing protein [Candidatus Bathyarchaeota archaeon]|nr:trypsin-like peptidase domain-containing protein [Candidatus Bathyarchaeota archaeon]
MTQLVNSLEFLKSLSDATSSLVHKLAKSVVSVNSRMSRGTGVVIDKQGYIVTCNHVLAGCSVVRVGQGEKTFEARVVGADPYNDLALLKVEHTEFEPIEFGDSDKLSTGQFILAVANPFNSKQPTATTGIITTPDGSIRGFRGTAMDNVIATDAKLNPGFSGGPLVDAEGKLIGINTAYVWQRGIAIPVNKVKAVTDRLLTGRKPVKAYLGVVANTVAIPLEIQEDAGLEQETGVMVFQVDVSGPAKKAGLTMGDVIVSFNGKSVADFYDLPRLLSEDVADKNTTITVIRREKLFELPITPTTKEEGN